MIADKRLLTAAEMVRRGDRVADIGTDHAYLAIFLVENNISDFVIAADISDGPLENAKNNLAEYDFGEKIVVRKSDGFSNISKDEIDTGIIAGMGGDVICKIIDSCEWIKDSAYELILQPMSSAGDLRKHLVGNGFEIKKEKAVRSAHRLYTVIKVGYTGKSREISTYEALVGKLDENLDTAAFWYIKRVRKIAAQIIDQLDGIERKLKLRQELIKAVEEIDRTLEKYGS